MSSLTDIIFLLLIFFMLTSSIVSPNALNLKLPSSSSKTVAPPTISISIDEKGNFYYGTKKSSLTTIKSKLRSEVRKASNPKDVTVTINAEERADIKYVVQIMDIALQLNIGAILATDPS